MKTRNAKKIIAGILTVFLITQIFQISGAVFASDNDEGATEPETSRSSEMPDRDDSVETTVDDDSEEIPEDDPEEVPEGITQDGQEEIPEDGTEEVPEGIAQDDQEGVPEDGTEEIPEGIAQDGPEEIPEDNTEENSEGRPEEDLKESPEESPVDGIKEASVTFSFKEGTQYFNPTPDYDLLEGVSALDENSEPVAVVVQDDGGFDIQKPDENIPFTVTYAATHPISGKVFTKTRDVYVTTGIIVQSNGINSSSDLQEALGSTLFDGTIILGSGFDFAGAVIINKSVTFKADSPITLTAASSRHFQVEGGNIELIFENVILDGGNNGGGIVSGATELTLTGAVIQNCTADGNGGGVSVNSHAVISLSSGTVITGNTALNGGGVYGDYDSTIYVTDNAIISENIATNNGGGVYTNGDLALECGSISNNRAEYNGGGIYGTEPSSIITVSDGTISGNTAGGGVPFGYLY